MELGARLATGSATAAASKAEQRWCGSAWLRSGSLIGGGAAAGRRAVLGLGCKSGGSQRGRAERLELPAKGVQIWRGMLRRRLGVRRGSRERWMRGVDDQVRARRDGLLRVARRCGGSGAVREQGRWFVRRCSAEARAHGDGWAEASDFLGQQSVGPSFRRLSERWRGRERRAG